MKFLLTIVFIAILSLGVYYGTHYYRSGVAVERSIKETREVLDSSSQIIQTSVTRNGRTYNVDVEVLYEGDYTPITIRITRTFAKWSPRLTNFPTTTLKRVPLFK